MLPVGTRLGPYEIVAAIGAGGMGEVYRARDTRLDRTVAIKVLAAHVAADPDSRERFEREAKSISALDHPHICALYDIGNEGDVRFLVMQYLEGETLGDRLARQPITIDEAFQAAVQIAGALDAAHRAGIVHRDLKPGNVMLTKTGVKLLDFGLAKIAAPANPVAGVTVAATRSAPLTQQGSLLGTLQYMSPEQLEGKDADARSDIFAFGAIVYEMLTGRRAFDSGSQAGIIAAILATEPPPIGDVSTIRGMPAAAGRALDRLLKKSLAKNPDDRWQSAADLADELKWIDEERLGTAANDVAATSTQIVPSRRRERWLLGALAASLLAAAGTATWALTRTAAASKEPIRFTIQPPDHEVFPIGPAFMAVSPDGRSLAFVTGPSSEKRRLWVRPFDSLTAQSLPGTDGAWMPLWSPDSRYIAFTINDNGGRLKKVDTRGGPPITVADWGLPFAWSPQGFILFTGQERAYRVDANGGRPDAVTTLDATRQEMRHTPAFFLDDGRRFVFHVLSADPAKSGTSLGSIDSASTARLADDIPSKPSYANGYMLYVRDTTLMAQPFDNATGTLTDGAVRIAENVDYNVRNGRAAVSVSANGVLAYRTGASQTSGTLAWFDRTGKRVASIPFEGWYTSLSRPQVSPDGRQLAVARQDRDAVGRDLWLIDLDRGIPSRLTLDPADDDTPVCSADGRSIVFRSVRNSRVGNLFRRSAFGGGSDELLYESAEDKRPYTFSPDGKTLLFVRTVAGTGTDIWALPMIGDRKPYPIVVSRYAEGHPSFSPDGRWFTYCSDDVPPDQVYVEPFPPDGTTRIRLSTAGGSAPIWSRDGKTNFYSTPDNHIMAVDVATENGTVRAGLPRELFVAPWTMFFHNGFAVDATGTRFLLPVPKDEQAAAPITVVLNWTAGLQKR